MLGAPYGLCQRAFRQLAPGGIETVKIFAGAIAPDVSDIKIPDAIVLGHKAPGKGIDLVVAHQRRHFTLHVLARHEFPVQRTRVPRLPLQETRALGIGAGIVGQAVMGGIGQAPQQTARQLARRQGRAQGLQHPGTPLHRTDFGQNCRKMAVVNHRHLARIHNQCEQVLAIRLVQGIRAGTARKLLHLANAP